MLQLVPEPDERNRRKREGGVRKGARERVESRAP